ncbi:MAG: ABC transporter ATP-binding protein [Oscillospiraceae bacterium]|jgi:iron complex transport system ATP-binding protein|nr:ABC transporter ATP-binding protein [Oscillospiraceae bacterium]
MSALLDVRNLAVRYGAAEILRGVSFSVSEGEWLMIAGPNGAGKSTIINAVTRGVRYSGEIYCDGRDIARIKPRELARSVGVLAQNHYVGYAFTVEEVVRLGRYSHTSGFLSRGDGGGDSAVEAAIDAAGLRPMLKQSVLSLSGGELQRAFLAQLLAQNPSLLILDEPTNHLDLVYQKGLFELITAWLKTPGRAVVSVIHDLSLARAFGSRAILLDRGTVVADGTPDGALSPENLSKVYGMDVYGWFSHMLGQWGAGE